MYVPRMKPDPSVRVRLGLSDSDVVVVMRPPATEAHYHNPESDTRYLMQPLNCLPKNPKVRVGVYCPRNQKQCRELRISLRPWIEKAKIIIPEHVVDGLHLIWACDLVISGGGTMNREAAALGVPVYSIFRGRTGAVDRYLAKCNRLMLLESVDDVRTKIVLTKRDNTPLSSNGQSAACRFISEGIISIAEYQCLPQRTERGTANVPPNKKGSLAMKMKVLTVVGARPNFMKAAPITFGPSTRIMTGKTSRSSTCWCIPGSTTTSACPTGSLLI